MATVIMGHRYKGSCVPTSSGMRSLMNVLSQKCPKLKKVEEYLSI